VGENCGLEKARVEKTGQNSVSKNLGPDQDEGT
jgi:hypothetical protein